MTTHRERKFVVTWGYVFGRREFEDEAAAWACFDREARVPSYINPAKAQPVSIAQVTTMTAILQVNP